MQQQNNNKDIHVFNYIPKKYGQYIHNETVKYQKIYGFEIGTGEHATHNNEADAFKHAFMQAQLTFLLKRHPAKFAGDFHEWQGNKKQGQPKSEEIMDNWNNYQGREIGNNVFREFIKIKNIRIYFDEINDIIAKKVIEKMNAGKLILDPSGRRMPRHKLINHSSTKKGCVGTYHVNGYKRADGTEVSDYYRTCGALQRNYGRATRTQVS